MKPKSFFETTNKRFFLSRGVFLGFTFVFGRTADAERMPFEIGHGRNVDVDVIARFVAKFSRPIDHQMQNLKRRKRRIFFSNAFLDALAKEEESLP